jgi:hypothetical protein
VLGHVEIVTKRAAEGIAECEHASTLDLNLADAHALVGAATILIGRAVEAEAHVLAAMRVSPRNTTSATQTPRRRRW